ncbi:MAG: YcaO-like family protein [Rhizonema sp. NSF051]|nr:YcaO-like family protein [Rhizonema sp. NSF051]
MLDIYSKEINSVFYSSAFKNYHISKSGVCINSKKIILGYAFSENVQDAVMRSRYEVLERFYGQQQTLRYLCNDCYVDLLDCNSLNKIGRIHIDNVSIGGRSLYSDLPLSANGLAIHVSLFHAIQNAKFEVLERYWCAQFWYTKSIYQLLNVYQLSEYDVTVTNVIAHASNQGLAIISIGYDRDLNFFAAGSAFHFSQDIAIKKAEAEMLSIIEDCFRGTQGTCTGNKAKVLSLRNKQLNMRKHKYFSEILSAGNYTPSFPKKFDGIASLYSAKNKLYAVRAISANITELERKRKHNTDFPEDPFL